MPKRDALRSLREICLALPDTEETGVAEKPQFRVGEKVFASSREEHGKRVLGFKLEKEHAIALVDSDDRFQPAPFLGRYGWVSMDADGARDAKELQELILESYRLVAPKRLVKELDRDGIKPAAKKRAAKAAERASKKPPSKRRANLLQRARKICLALPETTEKEAWGSPTFRVRDKMFASYADHHHGVDWVALWLNVPAGQQGLLVRTDPDRFFVPPYLGVRGWVGVRLERGMDWSEVEELAAEAYRRTAPKKLAKLLDDD